MREVAETLAVTLVGMDNSGVRTLVGALTGAFDRAESGERVWDSARIRFSSARPGTCELEHCDVLVAVVSAEQGVPEELSRIWLDAAERGIPALIVATHIDNAAIDIEEVAAMCRRVLADGGEIFLPSLPILADDESVCGFIDLLSEEIVDWSDGGPVIRASEQRHQELIEDARSELCESIMLAVDDDQVFADYMSGSPIRGEEIEAHMVEQINRGLRHPVFGTGVSPHLLGVGLILDTLAALQANRRT